MSNDHSRLLDPGIRTCRVAARERGNQILTFGEHRNWPEDGAFMIAQTAYQRIHRGRFLDHAPTGRPINFPLAVVIPFRDGLVAGERFYYDLATLLRQIGVLPTLGAG